MRNSWISFVREKLSMATSNIQLLGAWASPFSNRVQIALNLKSIEYEFIEENFYNNKSDRLLKANPVFKKIPVLIHDQKPVCESLIIVRYIDDVWTDGPSILPLDPYDRAVAHFWATYLDEKWFPLFIKELQKVSGDEERAAVMDKIFEGLVLLEDAFVKSSEGKGFFGGDNIGYLDIALGSYLGWIKVTESFFGLKLMDEGRSPGLAGWADRFCSHNSVKNLVPEAQKLVEFYMMVQASTKASSG